MRLIDVDKVIERERYYAEKYKGDFGEMVASHIIEILDSAPAVDAIPIKYIEEWISEKMGYGVRNGKVFTVMILEKLIEDWREKNGSNN